MPKYSIFALLCILIHIFAVAENSHSIGAFTQLNTKQSNALGFALKYQWQFSPSFALESQYSTSGDIKITTNSNTYIGDQALLSIGAVILKQYSPELLIKFSGGGNYVTSSSNESFIQQSSLSPYLKLALEYQLTEQFTIEAGHKSNFQSDQLGNNHNFFIGFNYIFSKKSGPESITKSSIINTSPPIINNVQDSVNITAVESLNQPESTTKELAIKHTPSWFLQLGAYSDELHADQALIKFKQSAYLTHYHVMFFNHYFRIVSPEYHSLTLAQQDSLKLKRTYNVDNIIKKVSLPK